MRIRYAGQVIHYVHRYLHLHTYVCTYVHHVQFIYIHSKFSLSGFRSLSALA